ncbi:hypothetical protein GIB67_019275 [Kingdonia uniflora]|uniref:1-deoxy-D-xylulose-5-phosphate reductoisomerase n=1 Tax=Kingdonia uniflora TaxID=39325 RepID=A0A7J7N048_9MAGN|nr:hypothetical protein GIB67_019275 [Kingdonia uniflora]
MIRNKISSNSSIFINRAYDNPTFSFFLFSSSSSLGTSPDHYKATKSEHIPKIEKPKSNSSDFKVLEGPVKALKVMNYTPWGFWDCNYDSKIFKVFFKLASVSKSTSNSMNLSDSIDNGKLYETFARFGNFSSCTVAATSDGKSKGYGFIQFNLKESATTAISFFIIYANGYVKAGECWKIRHFYQAIFATDARDWPVKNLKDLKVANALKPPNWNMGKKISVDSATLFNKASYFGLEVIDVHYLFGVEYDDIEIVIHPQSIIHSMIEIQDSFVLAQLGGPNMRLPILYTLSWLDRVYCSEITWPRLDLCKQGSLTFKAPDNVKYPSMDLAYAVGRAGGTMTGVLTAANEKAVEMFIVEN